MGHAQVSQTQPVGQDVMPERDGAPSLERALARTEADCEAALRAAASVTAALRRFRAAAKTGNLRELRPATAAAEQALTGPRQPVAPASQGWDCHDDTTSRK